MENKYHVLLVCDIFGSLYVYIVLVYSISGVDCRITPLTSVAHSDHIEQRGSRTAHSTLLRECVVVCAVDDGHLASCAECVAVRRRDPARFEGECVHGGAVPVWLAGRWRRACTGCHSNHRSAGSQLPGPLHASPSASALGSG